MLTTSWLTSSGTYIEVFWSTAEISTSEKISSILVYSYFYSSSELSGGGIVSTSKFIIYLWFYFLWKKSLL